MIIETSTLDGWTKARKTKPILARPIDTLINDANVASKLLLTTLEVEQALQTGALVCIGAANDAWQQTEKALLKKYNLTSFQSGWMIMTPKPENEALAVEITADFCDPEGKFQIHGKWGQKTEDGKFIQSGVAGDYILHNPDDPADYWIVNRRMFDNTYEIVVAARGSAPVAA